MKRTIAILVFSLAVIGKMPAQQLWNKKMPFTAIQANYIRLTSDGEQYFVHTDRDFYQIDQSGTISGHFRQESAAPLWSFAEKKYAPSDGHPFFWVVRRIASSAQGYKIAAYRPGMGFFNETTFPDSLGSVSWRRPQLVTLNDSISVVFGRKFCRKIRYSESAGFVEEWAKPLNIPVTSALLDNNRFILADDSGGVTALDENGNLLWSQNHAMTFRMLKAAPGGFIGCGRTTDNKAAIIRLDINGSEVWKQVTSDKEYRDIVPVFGGGFAVTGESEIAKVILTVINAGGQTLWEQEYVKGTGAGILQDSDGGFVVAAHTANPNGLVLFKTDNYGNTATVEDVLIGNRRIETASLQATFEPSPSLFFNGGESTFISKPDSAATIFSFAPWIGGLDENETLHLAAADYAPYVGTDYVSGLTNGKKRELNRVWLAKKEEIANFRRDFGADQTLDMPIPFDLLTWPAKSNPNLRYNLDFTPVETDPALFPAPFADVNGDGIYNAYDGDYPHLKGDQMAWWMLTDSTEHFRSKGDILGIDLFISAYTYDCQQTGSIDKSLFVDVEVINRSSTHYHNAFMGFFTDFDLGCYEDDYIGSIPDANTFYVYNQDALDFYCDQGIQGFGEDIPVQTVTFLNHPLDKSIFFNNPALITPSVGITDPDLPPEFYNYLQGKWKDGTPLTSGGIGYNPGSTQYANYVFPDNPADPQGWSLCTVNSAYADRRMINSHGPFDFASGDSFNIQIAFTLHPDIPHPCPDIFGLVQPAVSQISEWKNEGELDPAINLDPVVDLPPGQSVSLEPGFVQGAIYSWSTGETSPSITVSQPGEYSVTITLPTGCQVIESVLVQMGTSVGQPTNVPFWTMQPNPAKDFVHIECPDCSGDVQVILRNAQGTASINLQGQSRQFRINTQHLPPGFYWLEMWQEGRFLGTKKLVVAGK